ncbi:MAG: hypothetical protein R3B09_01620 [Nannocystaceae bacterium]
MKRPPRLHDFGPMAHFTDELRARQTIARWRSSGLGVVAFAKSEGISVRTFYRMRRQVEAEAVAADPRIVPVVIRTPSTAAPAEPFTVELASGLRIRVPVGFDPGELLRLCEALTGLEGGAAALRGVDAGEGRLRGAGRPPGGR